MTDLPMTVTDEMVAGRRERIGDACPMPFDERISRAARI